MKMKMRSSSPQATRRIAYTLAAGAAALAAGSEQDANADVVYVVPSDGTVPLTGPPAYGNTSFDLDGDTFSDIALKNFAWPGGTYQGLSVFGTGSFQGFIAGPYNFAYVSNLAPGALVDSSTVGPAFNGSISYGANNPNAQFNTGADGYIGLSFGAAPNLRYGWIRVGVDNANGSFVVKDWAYESAFNTGILVGAIPEPGTLGLLAAGSAGLVAMRRRRKAA